MARSLRAMSFFSFTSLGGERLAQTWGLQALHPGLVPWPGWLPFPAVEPRRRQPHPQRQEGTAQQHPLFRGGGSLALPLAQRLGLGLYPSVSCPFCRLGGRLLSHGPVWEGRLLLCGGSTFLPIGGIPLPGGAFRLTGWAFLRGGGGAVRGCLAWSLLGPFPAGKFRRAAHALLALGDGWGLARAVLGGGGHASPFHSFLGLPHAPLPRALPAAVVHGAHGGDVHRGGVHQGRAVLTLSLVGRGDGALQLALDALGPQQAEVLQGLHPRLECPRQWPKTGRRCPRAP